MKLKHGASNVAMHPWGAVGAATEARATGKAIYPMPSWKAR